ncbi:MAG TPA: ATP-binding protein [bacterium]|nr:ATP-binding protein [bacterium]
MSKYTALNNNMVSEYRLIDGVSALLFSYDKIIKSPNDISERDNLKKIHKEILSLLDDLDQSIVNYESRVAFNGLKNTIEGIFLDIEIGVKGLDSGDYLEAVNRQTEVYNKKDFIKDNSVNLILKELKYSKDLQIEIAKIKNVSQVIAILLMSFIVFFCVWYAFSFSSKFVAPLVGLSNLAQAVKKGNFNVKIDSNILKENDEVSFLANSFDSMIVQIKNDIEKLQKYNLEIKDSRDKLEEEKQKLQKYLNVAGVIVLIFDRHNNVFLINRKGKDVFGIEASEIIGEDWVSKYVSKKDQEKTKSTLSSIFNNNTQVEAFENVIIAKDGKSKNIVWRFSFLENKEGQVQAVLATGADITELIEAKATIGQLKELDKLKNEVLNIATHELKTPLVSIIGLSEVMKNNPQTIPTEYQNYISIINKEGSKLANLIKTMLTVNRNEVSKILVNKEKFDLISLIKSFKGSLDILVKKTDSKVVFSFDSDQLLMESDKAKISQVVYNLVDNAIKYGLPKQTITISSINLKNNYVRIEIKNEGKGIPKSIQKNLFLKFSQLEPSLSRSQDGMGLGLYICKQTIDALGGEIGVESEPNQGAKFYFTLPLISK